MDIYIRFPVNAHSFAAHSYSITDREACQILSHMIRAMTLELFLSSYLSTLPAMRAIPKFASARPQNIPFYSRTFSHAKRRSEPQQRTEQTFHRTFRPEPNVSGTKKNEKSPSEESPASKNEKTDFQASPAVLKFFQDQTGFTPINGKAHSFLGLEDNASPEQAVKAYRKLAVKLHPDKHNTETDEQRKLAEQAFKLVQAASKDCTSTTH